MPKILIYITSRLQWIFLFYGTDFNENRAHVHVGKRGVDKYCKIWLEPTIELDSMGELTENQISSILQITHKYREVLLKQWKRFKAGENIKMLTIKDK